MVEDDDRAPEASAAALQRPTGDVVAFLARGARPAANWLGATVPFLASPQIAAVVSAERSHRRGLRLASAQPRALQESRLGGGSLYFRFTPGNIRVVRHFPARTSSRAATTFSSCPETDSHPERICRALAEPGRRLYTPETVVVALARRCCGRISRGVAALGRARGRCHPGQGLRGLSGASCPRSCFSLFLVAGWALALAGGIWLIAWAWSGSPTSGRPGHRGCSAGLRFRSLRVAASRAVGSVAVHRPYAAALLVGTVRG